MNDKCLKCLNIPCPICGTRLIFAPSDLKHGWCKKCCGYYEAKTEDAKP
jgi:hypothetical protein